MHRLLRTGILITLGGLITCIISGCTDGDPTEYGEIKLLTTVPEDGGTISISGELKMVFDGSIGGVTVDGMRATIVADNSASMQIADLGGVAPGTKKTVIISWISLDYSFVGTQTISFTPTPAPATKVEVDPAPGGSYTASNTEFRLSFDQEVIGVWVNNTPASGSKRNWQWRAYPGLPIGPGQALDIKWINRNGSTGAMKVGPYRIADVHNGEPVIVGGTVADGAVNVDPAPINAGGFRFDFDEPVTGIIKLTDEAGVDLNWIGTVAGQTATLTVVAGQELVNGTTYKIEINVQDAGGNPLQVTITFVTKPK